MPANKSDQELNIQSAPPLYVEGAGQEMPPYWPQACAQLAEADPVLAKLAAHYTQVGLSSRGNAFSTLARSIVGQQISIKAAETVWQRLLMLIGEPDAIIILGQSKAALQACGLSSRKVEYLQDLSRHQLAGLLDASRWHNRSDDAIIRSLTDIRGVGRWTAEMFLIFFLLRPNVLPLDDVGLQKAMSRHYNHGEPISKLKMREIATHWQPWCSVATWLMWRSLEPEPVVY